MKIAIIGCPGSGKSTASLEMGKRMGLPVFHLDDPYHNAQWPENLEERRRAWREYQEHLVAKSDWVIDGNYQRTLDMRVNDAEMVVFLDFQTWICLWRVIKRRFQQICGGTAAGANPERIDLSFLQSVWNYRKTERPKVLALLETKGNGVCILKSPSALKVFLQGVESSN